MNKETHPTQRGREGSYSTLPYPYQKALAGKNALPETDFLFIDNLLTKYGAVNEKNRPFTRTEFFCAVSDITTYADTLRATDFIAETKEAVTANRRDSCKETELARPSSQRLSDIACMFLHIPRVKRVYDGIHIEKMKAALPQFSEQLRTEDLQRSESLPVYFKTVTTLMEESMVSAVDTLPSSQIEKLGIIMGYNEFGYMQPPQFHKTDVGTLGVETFTSLLEEVINHAITNNHTLQSTVTTEFSSNTGIAQRLMTIALREFIRLQDHHDLLFDEVDAIPDILDNNFYYSGACPALGKIDIVEGNQIRKRKIVDVYAQRILQAIPPNIYTS